MRRSKRLAAIDVGTNSTRVLVAECDGVKTDTVLRDMVITRLGAGVDAEGRVLDEAIHRTSEVVQEFYLRARELAPDTARIAATSALRDSNNQGAFTDRVSEVTGLLPEVLPGEEEARLSYLGAVSGLAGELGESGKAFVFDIGGGSTELMVGGHEIASSWSIDVGCVRMSERFLQSDPPSPMQIGKMESHIVVELKEPLERVCEYGFELAVGLAGTVTTISAIKQELPAYDTAKIHHSRISREDVEEIYQRLASLDLEKRKEVKGLEPERADIIVGGTAVLKAVMDLVGIGELLVSEKDILDGLVLDLYHSLG